MKSYNTDKFKKVIVALNTPFDKDQEVDTEATEKLVLYLYNKGVRGLYVCGSTGEGFLLTDEERKRVLEAVMKAAPKDMSIIVHVGSASTKSACELARHASEIKAHATSAVPSVYYRYSEESVYRHWTAITQAADLPFFIYNIPQLTGFHLSDNLLLRMLQNERVAGIKCSSEPVHDILRFKQLGREDFIVFNGPDEQYLAGRMMGADGGIGGTYAAMPELYLKLEELIKAEKFQDAQKLQVVITKLIYKLLSFGSLYGIVKALIKLDGLDIGTPRLPFLPISEKDEKVIELYQEIQHYIKEWNHMMTVSSPNLLTNKSLSESQNSN